MVDYSEAAEVMVPVEDSEEASQDSTRHHSTLALIPPMCMDLAEADYRTPKEVCGALAKADNQNLTPEVVTAVEAAEGASLVARVVRVVAPAVEAADGDLRLEVWVDPVASMAVMGVVGLAVAALDLAVALADLVDKAATEVLAPAMDGEIYSVAPVDSGDKVKELVAVPYLVAAMETVI